MNGTTPPFHRLLALAAAGTALFSTISTAEAVLIAGDSFVTGSGGYAQANLTNQPAGGVSPISFGFTGTYGLGETGLIQPVTAGLNYEAPGYSGTTGGAMRLTSSTAVEKAASRHLLRTIDPAAERPDTLYFSGLIQVPVALASTSGAGGFFEFSNRARSLSGGNTLEGSHTGFEFGVLGDSFVLHVANGQALDKQTLGYAPAVGTSTTNLFVLKLEIDSSGQDKFTLYLNPTNLTSEAQAFATAAFKTEISGNFFTSGDFLVNFGFRTQSSGANSNVNVYADEVRIGTSFNDVVAPVVPEPSLGTLLLGGMGALGCLRRRKQS